MYVRARDHATQVQIPLRSIYQECEFLIRSSWEMNPVCGTFGKCLKNIPLVESHRDRGLEQHAILCALSQKLQLRSAQQSGSINHRLAMWVLSRRADR